MEMKKVLFFLLGFVCVSLTASEPQKMPAVDLPILKEKLHILEGAAVNRIIENKEQRGITAFYRVLYKKVDFKKKPGDAGFVSDWERNRNVEEIFISGLDHDPVTTRGELFHKNIGVGQKGLWVWRIGVETVRIKYARKNKVLRLKKYTVDPKEAAEYYRKNKK